MLEVVFSDSAKGAMKMAKRCNIEGAFSNNNKSSDYRINAVQECKTREYRLYDVVNIGFCLDVGDITGEIDGVERQEVFQKIWGSVDFRDSEREEFFRMQREDFETLLSAAGHGVPIRIWTGNSPYSACAFSFVCHSLRKTDCKISIVQLPQYLETPYGTIASYCDWGEIPYEKIHTFLPYERELSDLEKHIHINLWESLMEENAPLRALVSGKLISVPENFYDHIIIRNIPDGEFTMAQLIGKILGKYSLGVGDGWYAMRINKMIEDKKLAVVGNRDSHPYGKILVKA